jgi:hypothetical protein
VGSYIREVPSSIFVVSFRSTSRHRHADPPRAGAAGMRCAHAPHSLDGPGGEVAEAEEVSGYRSRSL